MHRSINVTKTIEAVRSGWALTEQTFLGIGKALEASIEILSGMTSCFQTALTELNNEGLGIALNSLGAAAAQVSMLGSDPSGAASLKFGDMHQVAEGIVERISKMNRTVAGVGSLAINSRIAAASIRGSHIDFGEFADEIARTLKLTRSSLDAFGSGLQDVRTHVGSAYALQLDFEQSQSEATRSIPQRLTATVNAMPLQHKRNCRAIAAVGQRSERVRQQVHNAIVALQAGDVTRQRLEHIDYALGLLDQPALTEQEQKSWTIITCRLEAEQLAATAEEFERNVRQITASLHNMANEAKVLRTLANATYGSGGPGQGTFIGELEAEVGAALGLFENYGTARAQAASAMTLVADAAQGLDGHLMAVKSLEDDIRIMGLNTTLKCARVGPEGRALGLIAQELRAYGNEFAREATALIIEVERLREITASFVSSEPDAAGLVTDVVQAMKDSMVSMLQVGQTLDDMLATIERNSERVVVLLDKSVADLVANDGIGEALRQAARNLKAVAPADVVTTSDLAPRVQEMLDTIGRSYTMATERVIHARVLGKSAPAAAAPAVALKAELDDMLF